VRADVPAEHNGYVVIVERTCAGCGHRFRVDRDQPDRFCSALCSGSVPLPTLILEAQRAAAYQAFAARRRA
jgi:hypothetical protein